MPTSPDRRNTFILRIWRETDTGREQSVWRGWVQHISSGDRRYLQSTEELVRFIEGYAGKLDSMPQSRLK